MDKLIRKIEKQVPRKGKVHKELEHLEKEDKKRDGLVKKGEMSKKAMHKKHK
jgi:hypothetical protein